MKWLGLLGLLFIGLKLTNNIDWAWWIVLAPIWSMPFVWFAGYAFAIFYISKWGTPAEKFAVQVKMRGMK